MLRTYEKLRLQLFTSLRHMTSGEPVPLTGFMKSGLKKFEASAVIAAVAVMRKLLIITKNAGYERGNAFQLVV